MTPQEEQAAMQAYVRQQLQAPIGRENIPMLGTPAPVEEPPGYTDAIWQYLSDVGSGKIAYEGVLGPGYQGNNRALDIGMGFAGSGIQALKLLQKGLPIPEPILKQAPRIGADASFNAPYSGIFPEPRGMQEQQAMQEHVRQFQQRPSIAKP